jgi:hypothetical protein
MRGAERRTFGFVRGWYAAGCWLSGSRGSTRFTPRSCAVRGAAQLGGTVRRRPHAQAWLDDLPAVARVGRGRTLDPHEISDFRSSRALPESLPALAPVPGASGPALETVPRLLKSSTPAVELLRYLGRHIAQTPLGRSRVEELRGTCTVGGWDHRAFRTVLPARAMSPIGVLRADSCGGPGTQLTRHPRQKPKRVSGGEAAPERWRQED